MLLFEYYSDEKTGMLKPGMSMEETRKIIKSNYDFYKKGKFNDDNDYFISIGVIARYNDEGKLYELGLVDKYSIFMYHDVNLFANFLKVKKKLKEKKLEYTKDETGIELDKQKLGLYVPDKISDPTDPDYDKAIVEVVTVSLYRGCSVSFERLISNHIPSKESYLGSKISSDKGPAIRMDYNHQKYFATHGKSRAAKQYREMQKKLINEEKLMEVIQKDINDIKSKTNITYTVALKEMKDYARTLDPKDFMTKLK
jgi:hypothetical protein